MALKYIGLAAAQLQTHCGTLAKPLILLVDLDISSRRWYGWTRILHSRKNSLLINFLFNELTKGNAG